MKTWLSLEEWRQIMGINPLHFAGLSHPLLNNNTCGEVFFQYSWQNADRVGRQDIQQAIQQAEQEISKEVGYNLMPDWTIAERLMYARPTVPEAFGAWGGRNPRGLLKSVELPRGWIVSGGVRAKTLLSSGTGVVRTDGDTDGFAETCTVTLATTLTDPNEIHIYYPGRNGDDDWEIRPIIVSFSGGNVTIVFKVWQISAANNFEVLDPQPLDASSAASFETTVDIYRVYNDPSTQLQFLWENDDSGFCCGTCVACQLSSQAGCFHHRDARMGFIVPAPGSWNSDENGFDAMEWSVCRDPDQIRVWYYSGYVDESMARPYSELSNHWKRAVAYYAASMLDRPVCGCSNVTTFIERWRRDAGFNTDKDLQINITPEFLANRLGTTMGAIFAYKQTKRPGVRINK